jgi:REP element-mobilizing transposase RayT
MSTLGYQAEYKRFLPHIQPPGAILFLTFRLAGTIPKQVHDQLVAEQEQTAKWLAQLADKKEQVAQKYKEQKRIFGLYDRVLDQAQAGPTWLKEPQIAQLVADTLHYWHKEERYDLDCFTIMSNHVHVVFRPLERAPEEYYGLSTIMHSLKRHTAQEANKVLGRNGRFWQPESYDHVVRDEAELLRIRRYVLGNPVKAGLVAQWEDWPWSWRNPG